MTPDEERDRFGAGLVVGVAAERNGILAPERGFDPSPPYLAGIDAGRALYRRTVASFRPPVAMPPAEIPRRIRSDVPPRGGHEL